MIKYAVEFLGTFIFLSVILITGEAIPIAMSLAVAIYWGGKISGGCFNPAVSLMMYLNDKLNMEDLIMYITVQLLGGVMAYYFYKLYYKKSINKTT